MSIQDQGEGTSFSAILTRGNRMRLDVGEQSVSAVEVKEIYSSGDEQAPKVRKPYTITKQRERWTDEEHKKFLEALKLYGRAWRRIEEHVGTKTAVQIRSHAQKFFSKVVRESSNTDATTAKAIEIPPPRPKRKPMHPYPRKLVNTTKKRICNPQQTERTPSPTLSTSEQENNSPKSVLSTVVSDTLESAFSSPKNCSLSQASSKPCGSSSPIEKGNDSPSCTLLTEDENGSPFSVVATSRDLSPKNEQGLTAEAPTVALKLFGTTVLVTDSHRRSSFPADTQKSLATEIHHERLGADGENLMQTWPQNQTDNNGTAWNLWSCGNPSMLYYMQSQREDSNQTRGASAVPTPWWAMQGGFAYPSLPSLKLNPVAMTSASFPREASDDGETQDKEGSWTGSNNSPENELGMEDKISDDESFSQETSSIHMVSQGFVLKPSENSAFSLLRAKPNKCVKGFAPYKRCLAERDGESSAVVAEEREGHRTRLCL